MDKATFTPGPWVWDWGSSEGEAFGLKSESKELGKVSGSVIDILEGRVYSKAESDPARMEIWRPDADLIAAAPELYEALQETYDWMMGLPIPTEGCTAQGKRIYDALAKARGES